MEVEVKKVSASKAVSPTLYSSRVRVINDEKETLSCAICGHTNASDISKHIKAVHGMSQAEYVEKYPDSKVRVYKDKIGHLCRMLIDPTVSDSKFIEEFKVTFKKNIEGVISEKEKSQGSSTKRVSII